MVGTAVVVKRGLLPKDVIHLSLAKFSRIVLPIAPSEVMILKDNSIYTMNREGRIVRTGLESLNKSLEIRKGVEEFYRAALLPELVKFLAPTTSGWMDMVVALGFDPEGLKLGWVEAGCS
jgi:tRNA pseudouridine38-40 synthase